MIGSFFQAKANVKMKRNKIIVAAYRNDPIPTKINFRTSLNFKYRLVVFIVVGFAL
jgi:hypothetical protein